MQKIIKLYFLTMCSLFYFNCISTDFFFQWGKTPSEYHEHPRRRPVQSCGCDITDNEVLPEPHPPPEVSTILCFMVITPLLFLKMCLLYM